MLRWLMLLMLASWELRAAEWMAVTRLHPTQSTLGLWEVKTKRKELRKMSGKEARRFLKDRPVPVVLGPGGVPYMIDRHHLSRAAMEAGFDEVYVEVVADLSQSARSEAGFWRALVDSGWAYLASGGQQVRWQDIPDSLSDLVDDPYRSLAWRVRKKGGYRKTGRPFSEFRWADFFRSRIAPWDSDEEFDERVEQALALAKTPATKALPGSLFASADCKAQWRNLAPVE